MVKKKIKILLGALAIIVVFGSLAFVSTRFRIPITSVHPKDMGVEERLEDFEYLYDFVKGNWPYLTVKERMHGFNWLDLKMEFEERIKNAADNIEFLEIITAAEKALQNRHTNIYYPNDVVQQYSRYKDWYPMNRVFSKEVASYAEYWVNIWSRWASTYFHWSEVNILYDRGDYVIVDDTGTWEGSKITKVNGIPIDQVIKTCYDTGYLDWDFKRNKSYLWQITPQNVGTDTVFTTRNAMGQEADVTFATSIGFPNWMPYQYPSSLVNLTIFEEDKIGYFYIKTFNLPQVEPYYDDVLNFYQQIEDYEYLIIDIRGNTGGYFQTWVDGIVRPLIKEDTLHEYYLAYRTDKYIQRLHNQWLKDRKPLSKEQFAYLPAEVTGDDFALYNFSTTYTSTRVADFKGDIILLTDPVVYSAAEGFTNFCKQTGFATLYGTRSGGDGFFVWPTFCVLPNSKLVINMSSSMSIDQTGHANEEVRTQPDVYYESALGNHNELINYVLAELRKST